MKFARSILLCAFVLIAANAATARANFLSAFVNKAKDVGSSIGGIIGSPVGGLLDSLAQPTLRDSEGTARRLIGDVNTALGGQIDRVGGIVTTTVGQVNTAVADRISQVDKSLEARIVQIKGDVDDSVKRVFDGIYGTIGRIDAAARNRIAQIDHVLTDRLNQVDKTINKALADVDDLLTKQIASVNALVTGALQQADQIAQARIEQLDEVASKRIGNLDMVASKQTDQIEGAAIHAAALITLVVFVGLVLWWAFRKIGTGASTKTVVTVEGFKVSRLALQALVVIGGVSVILYLNWWLPRKSDQAMAKQVKDETAAFTKARLALDMRDARYHEAQLQLLDPRNATANKALLDKADLIHTVFTQPTKLQNASSLRDLQQSIANLDAPDDPDVRVVEAFVTWQVGGDRQDEVDAVKLCMQAIDAAAKQPESQREFILVNLAKHYVDVVLAEGDVPGVDPKALQDASERAGKMASLSPQTFQPAAEYDAAVIKLRAAVMPQYIAMLDAQAKLQIELDKKPADKQAADQARGARNEAASKIVDAWTAFDAVLASDKLAGDSVAFAAFSLDDAVLSHALYYVNVPAANGLTPALLTLDLRDKGAKPAPPVARTDGQLDVKTRIKIAPIRIEWARRYAPLLSDAGQQVVALQEAERFKAFERRASEFESSYVGFLIKKTDKAKDAAAAAVLGKTAALDAAEMGLGPLATKISGELDKEAASIQDDLRSFEKRRTLRLL